MTKEPCFHCGLPVPDNTHFRVDFAGQSKAMCCPGCEAVAMSIIENGLASFYTKRTAFSPQMELVPDALINDKDYDLASEHSSETVETSLIIDGITCSACIWLLEKHLAKLPGVSSFTINYATRRASVKSDSTQVKLSQILSAVREVGYQAYPYDEGKQQEQLNKERKGFISKMAVALFCGMQVMMITIGLYLSGTEGMDPVMLEFLRWVSCFFTVPVLLFSAKPFFQAAWRDLKQLRPGMDVPVSLGILGAFFASLLSTVLNEGETYYESVCMFVIFLLLARYIEFLTRLYAVQSSERISQASPVTALQRNGKGQFETVLASTLKIADVVQINAGAVIPADSCVISGKTAVDESILTGENEPVAKAVGSLLLGGSHNIESVVFAQVSCVGEQSTLSTITRLVDRAHAEKPAWVQRADRFAVVFVWGIILVTGLTAWHGWVNEVADWFSISLSVLVVTCPCALSLATPTAYTAAMSALFERGVVVTQGSALEVLASSDHIVFDKTGTLTEGSMRIVACTILGQLNESQARDIAECLEQYSDHPIANAFKQKSSASKLPVSNIEYKNGAGLSGVIDGQQYYLGSKSFIEKSSGTTVDVLSLKGTPVILSNEREVLAIFEIHDVVRTGVPEMIEHLLSSGKGVSLLSGDHFSSVQWLAKKVGIEQYWSDLSPLDKLDKLESIQATGTKVVMVGDGVNDAPVLAKADVSISVTGASQLARASSDILILGDDMKNIQQVLALSSTTNAIIRQNLCWALLYNIGALPIAIMGYIEPWQAALGMSVSSLVVVLNSFRLRFLRRR